MVLTDEAQVLAVAHQRIDGMRSAGYDRSDEHLAEATVTGPMPGPLLPGS